MKIRFVSMAAFALLVLDSSTGSDAKAFVDSSQGIGPTESSFSQRGLMRTTRIFNFIKNWIIDNKSYEDVTMSTNFINDVGMYKIRSITTQSHGLKSSDFFGV